MKKIVVMGIILLLVGCSNIHIEQNNEIDTNKENYLAIKKELDNKKEYISYDELPCSINYSVDRINEEEISYKTIINNPKENMYNVKALLIHDYFTEDIFPSIGIFEDTIDLIIDEDKEISLIGYIETIKDINELDLNMKLYIEYEDSDGNINKIYYNFIENKEEDII